MKDEATLSIFVDSSFLLTMLKQHQDFDELVRRVVKRKFRFVIPDRVLSELERLGRKKSSPTSGLARIAVELIEKRNYPVLETLDGPSDVDTSLIASALAQREPVTVATVDAELRTSFKAQEVPTISPRGRMGLMLSRPLPSSA